ncbi:MAG: ribonuclease [Lachnospiraceae bacterium]|nr:ribonuclease [Lachnospiraceae bacterium]
MKIKSRLAAILSVFLLGIALVFGGCAQSGTTGDSGSTYAGSEVEQTTEQGQLDEEPEVTEDGTYTSKEEVAAYLNEFGHLPDNFITKKEAKELGWDSKKGNLSEVAPGKSIGGDRFGNYEGVLPDFSGISYYECDINSTGGYRGSERLVYSDDGRIYYTEDHYQSFELLYGEE